MASKRKLRALGQLALTARASRTALSAELSGIGLYPGQDAVLLALAEADGMTLRALADRLQVKPPTVTKTIARLSAQGFLEKRASNTDARQSIAHLTEEGGRLVDRILLAQEIAAERALAGIRKKDRRRLVKLLQRMERNLEAPPVEAVLALPPETESVMEALTPGDDVPAARRARVKAVDG